MKKVLLMLLFAASTTLVVGQGLWLQKDTETKGGSAGDFEIVSYNTVVNTGTAPLTISVARQVMSSTPGIDNAICWQLCYLPDRDTALDPITINPGDTVFNFSGHLYPNGLTGSAVIKYYFFDVNNPSSQWEYVVTYNVFGIGLEEDKASISLPYPNPANNWVRFDVNTGSSPAKLDVYDMLGKVVVHKDLSARQGEQEIRVNVSHLQPGMYFYTLRSGNNEAVLTKRLLIQR